MLPVFLTPWALAGLVALPALAVIYYLRSRFRRQPVSSLMLWQRQREARCVIGVDYPAPAVDHAVARAQTLARFAAVRRA